MVTINLNLSLLIIIAGLLIFLGVLFAIEFFYLRSLKSQVLKLQLDKGSYQAKTKILNSTEQFLHKLIHEWTLSEHVYLWSQVDVASIFSVTNGAVDYYEALEDLNLSVDFLIVDQLTTKPLVAIEYDGPTHGQTNRKIRDDFVNRLFKDCQIELLRINPADLNNPERIKDQILEFINH